MGNITEKERQRRKQDEITKEIRIAKAVLSKHDYRFMTPTQDQCLECGEVKSTKERNWYKSYAEMYKFKQRIPLCQSCINKHFDEYMINSHGDLKKSLYLICQDLNVVFSIVGYEMAINFDGKSKIGSYLQKINSLITFKDKRTFRYSDPYDSTVEEVDSEAKRQEDLLIMTRKDLDNQKQIIEITGKDPFEKMSLSDRKVLMVDYLENLDEDIAENPFLLSQVEIVVVNNNIIRKMHEGLSRLTEDPDQAASNEEKIKGFINNIKNLVQATTSIAKENGIAKKNSDNKKRSTLTGMMTYYRDLNLDDIEVDFYDQVGSIGMQRVADISMKAIFDQGLFNDDDYEQILKHNVKITQEMEKRAMDAEEKVRQLKNENFRLINGGDVSIAMMTEEVEEIDDVEELEIVEELL